MDSKTEAYLKRLDLALKGITTSEKVKILTNAQSKIATYPSVEEALSKMPGPEQYAQKFLPRRKRRRFLGAALKIFGFITLIPILIIGFFAWKYSPLLEVSDDEKIVKVFGGLVELNMREGKFKFGEYRASAKGDDFTGLQNMNDFDSLEVNFLAGNMTLELAKDSELNWECKVPDSSLVDVESQDKTFVLNMKKQLGSNCTFFVPREVNITLKGNNGNLKFLDLQNPIDIELNNGDIQLVLDEKLYGFDLSVKAGRIDQLPEVSDQKYILKARMEAGVVKRMD